jgi:hypothetical protein
MGRKGWENYKAQFTAREFLDHLKVMGWSESTFESFLVRQENKWGSEEEDEQLTKEEWLAWSNSQ